jgi:hypothetical protein
MFVVISLLIGADLKLVEVFHLFHVMSCRRYYYHFLEVSIDFVVCFEG